MGKQICLALIVNADLDPPHNEEPQPLPMGETPQLYQFSKKNIIEELKNNKELLTDNASDSSGSESDPSEDNLDPEEFNSICPVALTPKPKAKPKPEPAKSLSPSKKTRAESNKSLTSHKDRIKIILKCKLCGEQEMPGHKCQVPKPKLRPIMKPQTTNPQATLPYYNAAGKKVRDQATQTVQVTQPQLGKGVEEQKLVYTAEKNNSISPVKKDMRVPYRTGSTDESSKLWRNDRALTNFSRNSRQNSAWKQREDSRK